MKNIFLSLFFALYALNLFAQFEYDCMDRNEFFISKKNSNKTDFSNQKLYYLKTKKNVEKQFGDNYKEKKQLNESKNLYYDCFEYDDGLVFHISEDESQLPEFHVKSNKYYLRLNSGQFIQVGMKAQELKALFPKSFEKRTVYKQVEGKKGKIRVSVYFSSVIGGEKQIEDSLLIFILNSEDGVVEEFYTWEPS